MSIELQASAMFPWNRSIRTRAAYLAVTFPANEGTIALISDGLRADPFAADLTFNLALHHQLAGNHEFAEAIFANFRRLAPNSKVGALQ